MLFPTPELPDNTPIDNVRFGSRIRNALNAAGMKAIGEVRETSADALLNCPALEVAQSPAFAKRSACHPPMACDQSAISHDPVPLIAVAQARLSDLI
jgi:hypothetical protein